MYPRYNLLILSNFIKLVVCLNNFLNQLRYLIIYEIFIGQAVYSSNIFENLT